MERCRRQPNVHFLGMKPTPSLPRYLGALDVGMMCYLRGTWAEYGYPLKLHEYLAAGLPIVSTALPLLRDFKHVTLTPEGDTEWSAAISDSLRRRSPDERAARQQIARQNSWDTRVTLVDQIVTEAYLRLRRGSDSAV